MSHEFVAGAASGPGGRFGLRGAGDRLQATDHGSVPAIGGESMARLWRAHAFRPDAIRQTSKRTGSVDREKVPDLPISFAFRSRIASEYRLKRVITSRIVDGQGRYGGLVRCTLTRAAAPRSDPCAPPGARGNSRTARRCRLRTGRTRGSRSHRRRKARPSAAPAGPRRRRPG